MSSRKRTPVKKTVTTVITSVNEAAKPVPDSGEQILALMQKHTHEEQNSIFSKLTAYMLEQRRIAVDAAYAEVKRSENASGQLHSILSGNTNGIPVKSY